MVGVEWATCRHPLTKLEVCYFIRNCMHLYYDKSRNEFFADYGD